MPASCITATTTSRCATATCCCSMPAASTTTTPRTSPAPSRSSGRFTPAQRAVYEVVLEAQRAAIDKVRAGNHWNDPHEAAVRVITAGAGQARAAARAGCRGSSRSRPTGSSSTTAPAIGSGIDVHDVGDYKVGGEWRVLEAGMALTVEPGIYIRPVAAGAQGVLEHRRAHRGRRAGDRRRARGADRRAREGSGRDRDAWCRPHERAGPLRHRHRRRRHGRREPGRRARGAARAASGADRGGRARCRGPAELRRAHHRAVERQPPHSRDPRACGRPSRRTRRPIRRIHVSDHGRFGFARIDAAEQGLPAMGYVVPNRVLGRGAVGAARARMPQVRVFCPAEVRDVIAAAEHALELAVRRPARRCADRARAWWSRPTARNRRCAAPSASRPKCATTGRRRSSPRCCRSASTTTSPTSASPTSGPLALLPLAGRPLHAGADAAAARWPKRRLRWTDAEFLAEVQRRFGFRLGRFLKVGRRVAYPLSLDARAADQRGTLRRSSATRRRACTRWPAWDSISGCATWPAWPSCIAEHRGRADAGDARAAAGVRCLARRRSRAGSSRFTDGLVRVFSNPLGAVRRLRNLGLLAFDLLPPAKAALSRLEHRRLAAACRNSAARRWRSP